MSRIQPPSTPPPPSENEFCASESDGSPAAPPTYDVILILVFGILLIQYIVLRCSNAVKKENISRALFIGFITTFIVSVLSVTVFLEQLLTGLDLINTILGY